MRRPDLKLLALARQGDLEARLELGRRYLLGVDGFSRHPATGLDYLGTLPTAGAQARAARLIAEALRLEELVQLRQEQPLARAAEGGSADAAFKHGVWLRVQPQAQPAAGLRWLERAAQAGQADALAALAQVGPGADGPVAAALLRTLDARGVADGAAVALAAVHRARDEGLAAPLVHTLRTWLAMRPPPDAEGHALVALAVRRTEETGGSLDGLPPAMVEAALEHEALRGDGAAAYTLGRALCGLASGRLAPGAIVEGPNLRKGVALLVRAADAGQQAAWLDLYHMHSDQRQSVANPQMALFCLEKAAHAGIVDAQRKLGAVLLKGADTLDRTEEALVWLQAAAQQDDAHARGLLRSLVLPLAGSDAAAAQAIAAVQREDAGLAMRLRLARHFGLTKLEALCVDPVEGLRPWGLVVGRNPFIAKIRLSAARAVPAVDAAALEAAREAAAFFARARSTGAGFEGDLRRRSLRQRRVFAQLGLDEAMFFATASATTLEALRAGPKWAFRTRRPLQLALAA